MVKQVMCVGLLGSVFVASGYLDNRYLFPVNQHLFMRSDKKKSDLYSSLFFMTADNARNANGEDIYLPALMGTYNLSCVNEAMNAVGLTNPAFLSEWSGLKLSGLTLPFASHGKIRATGLDFGLEYNFYSRWSVGAAFSLMHVTSRYDYALTSRTKENLSICSGGTLYPGRERALELARLQVNKILGLRAGQWSGTGLSDTDLYVRVGAMDQYLWKFQQVDASLFFGCIAPTGKKRDLYAPASIPFGGDGLWGAFVKGQVDFELTDDWYFGTWLYLSKRFSKCQKQRMPAGAEPLPYGVIVDSARINPGVLFAWSPYLIFDDIQDGFGAYLQYNYIKHGTDTWSYQGSYSPNLLAMQYISNWTNEFFTIGIDYDFTKRVHAWEYGPRIYFDWTLPMCVIGSKNVAKTHRVTLGIDYNF